MFIEKVSKEISLSFYWEYILCISNYTSLNLVKKYAKEWYQNMSLKKIKTTILHSISQVYFTFTNQTIQKMKNINWKNDSVPWETEF